MISTYIKLIPPVLVVLGIVILGQSFRIRSEAKHEFTPASQSAPVLIVVPHQDTLPTNVWTIFNFSGEQTALQNDRYRLAGTFFVMGPEDASTERQRLAIIDDVTSNHQYIVSESQVFQEYEILRIYQDRLIMRRDGIEVELTLSFQKESSNSTATAATAVQAEKEMADDQEVLESNRFTKRIGEKRWVVDKEAIVGYYKELLDDPERIAAVYSSLQPDYDEEGAVGGYVLQKEGENEFFDSVGLLEGDTIRKVNSMRMTSQNRAEYFIGEFMKERLGAVVLDIERGGKSEKLIYLFR